MDTAMSGWTLQATTGVAFVPFSSGAASLCGARPMVLNWHVPRMETVKERTQLGARTTSPTHFGQRHTGFVSNAFGWTPTLHSLWGPLAVGTPQAWSRGARRMAACTPSLAGAALGTTGAGALVLHPRPISVTSGMSLGVSAPLVHPAHPGVHLPQPCLALGTGFVPRQQCCCRGTWWGRGVFHRVFHMLAPAVSPLCP